MVLRKLIIILCSSALAISSVSTASAGSKSRSSTGPKGQTLTVSTAGGLKDGQEVTVYGKNYDPEVGIYVAYCEISKPGIKPEHCFGGININGSSKGSIWITSHKPFLVPSSVVRKFGKNGSFKVRVMVAKFIDQTDCSVVKCGVVTRADHTRSDYRKADVQVPVSFK